MNRLKVASEKAKISLSDCEKTEIFIDEFYNDQILNIELTRNEFENICQDLFGKLIKPLAQILKDKKKNPSDIQEVILVGASTKIPKIKKIPYFPE